MELEAAGARTTRPAWPPCAPCACAAAAACRATLLLHFLQLCHRRRPSERSAAALICGIAGAAAPPADFIFTTAAPGRHSSRQSCAAGRPYPPACPDYRRPSAPPREISPCSSGRSCATRRRRGHRSTIHISISICILPICCSLRAVESMVITSSLALKPLIVFFWPVSLTSIFAVTSPCLARHRRR